MTYSVKIDYIFEADTPKDAADQMFAVIESGDFNPGLEVFDEDGKSVGVFWHSLDTTMSSYCE